MPRMGAFFVLVLSDAWDDYKRAAIIVLLWTEVHKDVIIEYNVI